MGIVDDFTSKRFRDAGAPESADLEEAVINTVNEGLDAFADGKIDFWEISQKLLSLIDDWAAAGKDFKLIGGELKTLGWDTAMEYIIADLDEGIVFPPSLEKIQIIIDAALNLAKAMIQFYFAIALHKSA